MFAISKLSADSQAFITRMVSSGRTRSKEVSLAIARVLTRGATIPSNAVEDPIGLYRTQMKIQMESLISQVNEFIVIDTEAVSDFCLKFFMYRYNAAHMGPNVLAFDKETAVEDFFGISKNFDKETLAALKNDPIFIVGVMNGLERVIQELAQETKAV